MRSAPRRVPRGRTGASPPRPGGAYGLAHAPDRRDASVRGELEHPRVPGAEAERERLARNDERGGGQTHLLFVVIALLVLMGGNAFSQPVRFPGAAVGNVPAGPDIRIILGAAAGPEQWAVNRRRTSPVLDQSPIAAMHPIGHDGKSPTIASLARQVTYGARSHADGHSGMWYGYDNTGFPDISG